MKILCTRRLSCNQIRCWPPPHYRRSPQRASNIMPTSLLTYFPTIQPGRIPNGLVEVSCTKLDKSASPLRRQSLSRFQASRQAAPAVGRRRLRPPPAPRASACGRGGAGRRPVLSAPDGRSRPPRHRRRRRRRRPGVCGGRGDQAVARAVAPAVRVGHHRGPRRETERRGGRGGRRKSE